MDNQFPGKGMNYKRKFSTYEGKKAQNMKIWEQQISKHEKKGLKYEVSCGEQIDIVEEQDMKKIPHRHIGTVICLGPGGAAQFGTGILISKNLVLTCAHVIHSRSYNAFFPNIYFYPGVYGPFEWNRYEVEDSEAPEQFRSTEQWLHKKGYDYALLKLKQDIQEKGFIQLSEDMSEMDKKSTTISIYGYPDSKYEKKNKIPRAVKQFGLTRKGYILDVYDEAGYMVHRISTEPGQSGAPIIKTDSKGIMTIVGIHVGSPDEEIKKYQEEFPTLQKINIAKLTNKFTIRRLTGFAQKLKGEMFGVAGEVHNSNPDQNMLLEKYLEDKMKEKEQQIKKELEEKMTQQLIKMQNEFESKMKMEQEAKNKAEINKLENEKYQHAMKIQQLEEKNAQLQKQKVMPVYQPNYQSPSAFKQGKCTIVPRNDTSRCIGNNSNYMALSKKGSPGQVWEFKKVNNEEYCIFRLQNGKKEIVWGNNGCFIQQYKEEYEKDTRFRWVIEKRGEDEKGQHLYSIKNVCWSYRMNYRDDDFVVLATQDGQNAKWGGNTREQYQQWQKEGRDLWYILPA